MPRFCCPAPVIHPCCSSQHREGMVAVTADGHESLAMLHGRVPLRLAPAATTLPAAGCPAYRQPIRRRWITIIAPSAAQVRCAGAAAGPVDDATLAALWPPPGGAGGQTLGLPWCRGARVAVRPAAWPPGLPLACAGRHSPAAGTRTPAAPQAQSLAAAALDVSHAELVRLDGGCARSAAPTGTSADCAPTAAAAQAGPHPCST